MARCGGKPEVRGRKAREISITVHQTGLAISLDRPPATRGKNAGRPDQLRFAILGRYDRDQVRASWQDGGGGRLKSFTQEIAVEVVTSAEISYRENCIGAFEWRVQRKVQLDEARQPAISNIFVARLGHESFLHFT